MSPTTVAQDADFARTVGDVADEAGVAPSAVRFYESHGIIHARRNTGNQRRFDDSAACRIKVAKLAQRVGLTVREITELFDDLPTHPAPDDWGRITDALVAEAERRVAALRSYLAEMGSDGLLCQAVDHIDA
ncbi:MerR family transcriptional regulator [Williamsia sterculiae]|uniref:MerR family transcriptional regulator, redox-sensitive transcriptional activator SoxR n=1 Tax=Williamsia sterculiae TaxID=1344003 RepID=A0A1N7DYJ4_9NOCA|nr:MerR family transcriptional regulator [Williamsia sterculiae]SIR80894.1 MerR family transcriptional regulator, redox-sensitive transcriptional activator SoxR [Williamsia sterculiae]